MSLNRHQIREAAFQVLFALSSNAEASHEDLYHQVLESYHDASEDVPAYLSQIVDGVLNHQTELDEEISKYLKKTWSVERLARTDHLILQIAFFEINYVEDVPNKVAINEALELAKKFADDTAKNFINGVLSSKLG
ncbi:transcription antitermination factor NusB [Pediococcus ethanolidurans]|uniref:transcription antitermination factor NusB n=1 Tax=Pediococcus ethanolidurans TaxID=319653 RepID=UPI002952998F|nr:transcription antitermination factor NusB [Pediococcus ethanolidurans]MDV7719049.1 transcription antitermination factor NusB [Pediococcus ethanolidurans]